MTLSTGRPPRGIHRSRHQTPGTPGTPCSTSATTLATIASTDRCGGPTADLGAFPEKVGAGFPQGNATRHRIQSAFPSLDLVESCSTFFGTRSSRATQASCVPFSELVRDHAVHVKHGLEATPLSNARNFRQREMWSMSQVFWCLFLWFFGLIVGIVAHEAGHLLCARIGSIPIRQMVIGWGPVLLRGRVGELQLELRLLPLCGFVVPAASAGLPKRWAVALYLLGGVLGNIAVIGVVVWLHVVGAAPKVRHDIGVPLILTQMGILVDTQVFLIVLSLIPQWGKLNCKPICSDGLQLLKLLLPRLINAAL